MAFNNQEIELKLPISKKDYYRIKRELGTLAEFIGFSHHMDEYFTPRQNSFLKEKYPFKWLAIRRRDKKVILNYKHWYPEGNKYTTHCDEYEVEVSSFSQLKNILKELNFHNFTTVDKKREIFRYKNELEIALDEVADLGYFIEIEVLRDFGGVKQAQREIFKFARRLGLNRTKTVPGGYAAALLRKKKLFKV